MSRHPIILLILPLLIGLSIADKAEDIEWFVNTLSRCAKNPAISVAAYRIEEKDKDFDFAKGFNYINKGSKRQVTPSTRFCIGGATQAFTAVLLAKLLEQKNDSSYSWDTPVVHMLTRNIGIPNQFVNNHLSLKDILSMRSGLAGMDILPLAKPFKDAETASRYIRDAPQVAEFRDRFVYNEALFAYVELVLTSLGNDSWANLIKKHVLEPLQMRDTVTLGDVLSPSFSQDIATGMVNHNTESIELPFDIYQGYELVAPATSLCTSARNMLIWLRFILREGKDFGLLSTQALTNTFQSVVLRNQQEELFQAQDISNNQDFSYSYTRDQNALGWIKGYYRGYSFLSQDGSLPGYQTLSIIIPSKKIGVYTSLTGDESPKSYLIKTFITHYILDLLLDKERYSLLRNERTNICTFLNEQATKLQAKLPLQNVASRAYSSKDLMTLSDYEGTYRSRSYGDIVVQRNVTGDRSKDQEMLYLTYGLIRYEMRPTYENQTFSLRTPEKYWFSTNADFYSQFRKVIARFDFNSYGDDGQPAKIVTIEGFDRNVKVVFSTNPRSNPVTDQIVECSSALMMSLSHWTLMLSSILFFLR